MENLKAIGHFSLDQLQSVERMLIARDLAKDELLLRPNEVCRSIYFLAKGTLMQYQIDEELEKQMVDLYIDKDWVLNHSSFTLQKPSKTYIQAFEASYIFELTMISLHSLIAESQSFFQLGKILGQTQAQSELLNSYKTLEEKYLYLLNHKPTIIQRFPQKMIASYLGISPETLSRVRKRI